LPESRTVCDRAANSGEQSATAAAAAAAADQREQRNLDGGGRHRGTRRHQNDHQHRLRNEPRKRSGEPQAAQPCTYSG